MDQALAFPELTYLRDQGFRIWYDEGIDPGNEWPEEVAKALAAASFFIVFITPNAVQSQNVRNEIYYSLNNEKPFTAIYLRETHLLPGLELRMGEVQAIMKYRMAEETYRGRIEMTLPRSLVSTDIFQEIAAAKRARLDPGALQSLGNELIPVPDPTMRTPDSHNLIIRKCDEVRTSLSRLGSSLPELIKKARPQHIRPLERVFEINTYALTAIESYFKMIRISMVSGAQANKEALDVVNGWLKFISHCCEYDCKYLCEALSQGDDAAIIEILNFEKDIVSTLRDASQIGTKENADRQLGRNAQCR